MLRFRLGMLVDIDLDATGGNAMKTRLRTLLISALGLLVALLIGCSSAQQTPVSNRAAEAPAPSASTQPAVQKPPPAEPAAVAPENPPAPEPTPAIEQPDPAPAEAPATQTSEQVVYITNTGTKYHAAGCRYLKKSSIKTTLDEAKSQGLTACSVCNP